MSSVPLAPNPANTPDELQALPQWVGWKPETRKGKTTKVPYDPKTGQKASSTDPATWGTYPQALDAYQRGKVVGVGFVFTKDDPYVGVDLDHVRDPKTGVIEPEAQAIIDQLDSYTELSVSSAGLHVIVLGKLPPGARRRGNVEMYDSARFFVTTGDHLEGTPLSVEDRTSQLADLHLRLLGTAKEEPAPRPPVAPIDLNDDELLRRAMNAKNGHGLRALWNGDTSGHGGDASTADAALAENLLWWTQGDIDRAERFGRRSGLNREKWDERRGDVDYWRYTVERVAPKLSSYYEPPKRLPRAPAVDVTPPQEPAGAPLPPDECPDPIEIEETYDHDPSIDPWAIIERQGQIITELRAENQQLKQRYKEDAEFRSLEAQIERNKSTKTEASTYAAILAEARRAEESGAEPGTPLRISFTSLGQRKGYSPASISRHVATAVEHAGWERHDETVRILKKLDPATGEIIEQHLDRPITQVSIVLPGRALDVARQLANLHIEGRKRPGGNQISCPDHPNAKTKTFTTEVEIYCTEPGCNRLLYRGDPDQIPTRQFVESDPECDEHDDVAYSPDGEAPEIHGADPSSTGDEPANWGSPPFLDDHSGGVSHDAGHKTHTPVVNVLIAQQFVGSAGEQPLLPGGGAHYVCMGCGVPLEPPRTMLCPGCAELGVGK